MDLLDIQKAKRPRVSSACSICRKRKVKCDKRKPTCAVCERHNVSHLCEYSEPEWSRMMFEAELKKASNSNNDDVTASLGSSPDSTNFLNNYNKSNKLKRGASSNYSAESSSRDMEGSKSADITSADELLSLKQKIADLEKIIQNFSNNNNNNNNNNNQDHKMQHNHTVSSSSSLSGTNEGLSPETKRRIYDKETQSTSRYPTTREDTISVGISPMDTKVFTPEFNEKTYEEDETLDFMRTHINYYSDARVAPNVALLSSRCLLRKDPLFEGLKKTIHRTHTRANILQTCLKLLNVKSVIKSKALDKPTEALFQQKVYMLWKNIVVTEKAEAEVRAVAAQTLHPDAHPDALPDVIPFVQRKKGISQNNTNIKTTSTGITTLPITDPSSAAETPVEGSVATNSTNTNSTISPSTPKLNDHLIDEHSATVGRNEERITEHVTDGQHSDQVIAPPKINPIEPIIPILLSQESNGILPIISMKTIMSGYSKEVEVEIVRLAIQNAPIARTTWVLIDRFFKYIHPFAPFLDQKTFERTVKKLIGPRSKKEEKVKLKISNRLDLLQTSLLCIVLVFGSYTLRTGTKTAISNEDNDPDIKYVLENPIGQTIIDLPKKCMTLFQVLRWSSLELLQLSVYSSILEELEPNECDLKDTDVITSPLEQMAISLGLNRDPSNFVDIVASESTKNIWRKIWYFIRTGVSYKILQHTYLTSLDLEDQFDTKLPVYLGDVNANNNDLEIEKASVYYIHQHSEYKKITKKIFSAITNFKQNPLLSHILDLSFLLDKWIDRQYTNGVFYNLQFFDKTDSSAHHSAIKRLNSLSLILEASCLAVLLHYQCFIHYQATNRPQLAYEHYRRHSQLVFRTTYICLAATSSLTSYFGDGFDLIAIPMFLTTVFRMVWNFAALLLYLCHLKYWRTLEGAMESDLDELIKEFIDLVMTSFYEVFRVYAVVSHNYYFAWIANKVNSFIYSLLVKVKDGTFKTDADPDNEMPQGSVSCFYHISTAQLKSLFAIAKFERNLYIEHLAKRDKHFKPKAATPTSNNATNEVSNNVADGSVDVKLATGCAEGPLFGDTPLDSFNNIAFSQGPLAGGGMPTSEDWNYLWNSDATNDPVNSTNIGITDEVDSNWLNKMISSQVNEGYRNGTFDQMLQMSPENVPCAPATVGTGQEGNEALKHLGCDNPTLFGTAPDSPAVSLFSTNRPPMKNAASSRDYHTDNTVSTPGIFSAADFSQNAFTPGAMAASGGAVTQGRDTDQLNFMLDDLDQVLRRMVTDIGL